MNNTLKTLILTLALSLLALPSWGADLTMDDLVYRNGLYYKKFTNEPFTGEVSGKHSVKFKSGKAHGVWEWYYDNGQLREVRKYKDGKRDGLYEGYYDNGQLGSIGKYKEGNRDGLWEWYYDNGQLGGKGNYEDDKRESYWEFFNEDGTVDTERTGTYKNGVKQD
tara:strand:- start:240 stop:734 length:495 start_codon:yes stop_codon:yes gene_type:complete